MTTLINTPKINLRTLLFLTGVILIASNSCALAHTDVTAQQARDLINSTNDLIVVDVREPSEYCGAIGHIPGALNYPLSSGVLEARYEKLPIDGPVLVVCQSGSRSNQASSFLDSKGFSMVYDMMAGMSAWIWETEPCKQDDDNETDSTETNTYVFLPDRSTLLQTGGIAGVNWNYSVEGHFWLTVDTDAGTGSFALVDAKATDDSLFERTLDPNRVFNMTSLLGKVLDETIVSFTGIAYDGSDIKITTTFRDDLVHLVGKTTPPPNSADFFIFNLDCFAQRKYSGGTGEPNTPYRIATAEDLMLLGESPEDYDKHFILTADIDLDPNLPRRKVFDRAVIAPDTNDIEYGFQGASFSGVFDGNDNTVRNLTIRCSKAIYIGLFGKIGSSGGIYDLRLEDINVNSSGSHIAGLVGYNQGSITNCYLSGSVSGGTEEWCSYLALMAGRNQGRISHCDIDGNVSTGSVERGSFFGLLTGSNKGIISDCDVRGSIVSEGHPSDVGGLVGINFSSIADCHSTVNILINSNGELSGDCGGLVGTNEGMINRCYATGDVSFGRYSDDAGGLVGVNIGSVINCYASGDVSGTHANWRLGGLVGWNYFGNIVHCYARGKVNGSGDIGGLVGKNRGIVSHAYATGQVIIAKGAGGLVGDGDPEDVSRCYWDIETSGQTTSEGGEGVSTAKLQEKLTFTGAGWDFVGEVANGTSDLWQMPEGGGYPELTFFSDGYRRQELPGSGTPEDPYLITTDVDMGAIVHYDSSGCYRLIADVNLADIVWTTMVIPSFDGTFDGNGFTISNLTIHGGDYLGLFGVLDKHAVVENLGIQDTNIVGSSSASDLGILAVENWGLITNCTITGNVSGGQYEEHLGGIVKYNVGTITNCDPIDYDGPYSVIITNPEATREFLMFEGIEFDHIWIPEDNDLEGLDSILKAFLESDESVQENMWFDREYILDNLPRYDKEYSGFILNDSKYIICQMICWSGFQGSSYIAEYDPGKIFTKIFDGGCGIVRVIFDANSKAVISISCNF